MDYDHQFEDINWRKYWLILKRGKSIALTVFSLVTFLGLLYALLSKPLYKSEAKLLIKTNNTSSLTGLGENIGRIETLTDESDPLNAQVEILLSNTALEQTIRELQLKNEQGELIPIKKLGESIKVDALKGTDVLKVNYTADEPQKAATVVEKLVEIFIEQNIRDNRIEAGAARKFILKQLPQSEKIVTEAEFALRQFKEKNNVTYFEEESSASIRSVKELEEKISDSQAQLVDTTARLNNLKRQTSLGVDEAAIVFKLSQVPGIQGLLTELQGVETQLSTEQTRFQAQNPVVIGLTERLNDLERLLQERIEKSTGSKKIVNWRSLQVVDSREESQIQELLQTEKERIGLEKRLVEMRTYLSSSKEKVKVWPGIEQSLKELERNVATSQTTYETLLTRLQEINVAENQNVANVRVISRPLIPTEPFNSHKKTIVLASGILGVLLGVGVTLVIDMIDKSLKTVEEAKRLFPYNLLATIPNLYGEIDALEMKETGLSFPRMTSSDLFDFRVRDAYQLLQANLSFCSESKPKTITVTSSVSNEGKSRICANLALSMAQGDSRVLLIDGNLRNPTQHEIWELSNSTGLINLFLDRFPSNSMISGQIDASSIIRNVMPNLDVLTSGGVFNNTLALFESNSIKALVGELKKHYDFIIFDAPSLKGNADAGLMSKLSDGIVFVVRTGVADKESVKEAKEFIQNSRQKVLGMVVNEAKVSNVVPKTALIAGSEQRYLKLQSEIQSEIQSESPTI